MPCPNTKIIEGFILAQNTEIFKYQTINSNPMLTVRTQIKEILKDSELGVDNISGDFIDRLDERVKVLFVDAAKRAKENGRRTVMGKDV